MQCRVLDALIGRALAAPAASGSLEFLDGRRLVLSAADLGLSWVITLQDGRVRVGHGLL